MTGLTYWSLFTGIGGLDLGLDRAGFRPLLQCELDPFRRDVAREHWPDVKMIRDVRDVSAFSAPRPTVMHGGFPCSDVSNASATKTGVDGERSGLWGELRRLVRAVRPRYLLVENVAALATRGLPRVVGDLAALGYDAEWDCLPASAFFAPHRRDRIFIVAYAHCERCPRGARVFGTRGGPEPPVRRLVRGGGPDETWPAEPDVARMAHGIPGRVDRVEALGRAVVPRVARHLGDLIRADAERRGDLLPADPEARAPCSCW